jgi:hypothetical protein
MYNNVNQLISVVKNGVNVQNNTYDGDGTRVISVYFEAGFYTNQVWSLWQYYWHPSWGSVYIPVVVSSLYIPFPFDFWWFKHQNPWPTNN